jgi:hypothetical protein
VDAAIKKLLEIANAIEADHAGRISVGASPSEYSAAVRAAIDRGFVTMHPSGGYLTFTQAGADLFA